MSKVHLLSLGCPKNLVDSEHLLKRLRRRGIRFCPDPGDSDFLMVNTCGFIEAAKKESIEEILRISEYKARDGRKKLIVFGCLAERFGEELKREMPEIDAVWGVDAEKAIAEYCGDLSGEDEDEGAEREGRSGSLGDTPYSYLKISDGCDRGCTYCVIPGIRGKHRSREAGLIISEAGELVGAGARELILVAQDITSYGKETGGPDLAALIRDIAGIGGDFWVRLLYLYPTSISDRLLARIAEEEKVCKYIDMPLQHASERVLKLMGRGGGPRFFEDLISRIRERVPGVALRTTFITGFPGESDEDFETMLAFVRRMEFDRLGVFTYSREEGTPAAKMKGQVPKRIKEERYGKMMEAQSAISLKKNMALVGKTLRALVDDAEEDMAIARLSSQAPEIDGVVLIRKKGLRKGEFIDVRITGALDYDLEGSVVR